MDTKTFLSVMRANTTGDTELRVRPVGKTHLIPTRFKTIDEAVTYIEANKETNDIWYGVSTRNPETKTGTKKDCLELPAIWLDIDRADNEVKNEVIEVLASIDMPKANLIVKSGHGYHFYWLINPIKITPEILKVAEGMMRSLKEKINKKLNIKIDDCQNIDRILRVPGSSNFKFQGKVVPCEVDEPSFISPRDRFFLEVLAKKTGTVDEKYSVGEVQQFKGEKTIPVEFKGLFVSLEIMDIITKGEHSYSSRSEADQAIITSLVGAGLSNEQIKTIFDTYPTSGKYHDRKTHKESYLAHSIAKAKGFLKPSLRSTMTLKEAGYRINSGFKSVDQVVGGFRSGNVYLIGGYQKSGKTSFCLSIVNNLLKQGVRVGYLDTELTDEEFKISISANYHKIKKSVVEKTPQMVEDWLNKYDQYIYHAGVDSLLDQKKLTISFDILTAKTKQFINSGAKVFIFDNLTTFQDKGEKGEGIYILSNYLSRIINLTKYSNVVSFVIIHQKKDSTFSETPEGVRSILTSNEPEKIFQNSPTVVKKPTNSNVYGTGGAISQLSGSMLVWRPYQLFDKSDWSSKSQIILENFRHSASKEIRMEFDGEVGAFIEQEVDELTQLGFPDIYPDKKKLLN